MDRKNYLSSIRLSVTALLFVAPPAAWGQPEPQLDKREIWDSNFLSKRPASNSKPLPKSDNDGLVGLTLWKLRPSKASDDPGVRTLIHEPSETRQWTPDRISADSVLHDGDKIRFSIESARSGYLYVIDCDEYANGAKDYYLIFPELRIRSGDNHITPGRVIELPSPNDAPPFFKVAMSRPDEVGERLSILISPKPIEQLPIENDHVPLSVEQVNHWIERWKATEYRLEAQNQVGKPYTLAEKSAGSGEKLMTQADPVPQTIYLVKTKPGDPLLVHVPLSISK